MLCSVVLLVVVCNLLGLNLGIWGLSAREDPSHSEAKGESGARFLMVYEGLGERGRVSAYRTGTFFSCSSCDYRSRSWGSRD